MTDDLLERLLREGESSSLDYKRDQYRFTDDKEKSELLKDILAFANAWRHADAYILIGVEELKGSCSVVHGIAEHFDDSTLQQFVNSKTNQSINFSYSTFSTEGKKIGVIEIPQQNRPVHTTHDFGKVKKDAVYFRQGTSTAVATPVEISKMGLPIEFEKAIAKSSEPKTEQVDLRLGLDSNGLYVGVYNRGEIEVCIKHIEIVREKVDPFLQEPFNKSSASLRLIARTEMPVADGKGSVVKVALGDAKADIRPRREVEFSLTRMPAALLRHFLAEPADSVRLSVSGFRGEITSVGSERIVPLLRSVLMMYEAMEEAETPKVQVVNFYPDAVGDSSLAGSIRVVTKQERDGHLSTRVEKGGGEISLTKEEAMALVDELGAGRVIGSLRDYQWRIDS